MTATTAPVDSLAQHWALAAIGEGRIREAFDLAKSLYIANNLGSQLSSTDEIPHDAIKRINDVALAYELVAAESVSYLHGAGARGSDASRDAEAAAHCAFELLRALPLDRSSSEALIRQVLQLGAYAYCSDRWAEFRGWLRDRQVDTTSLPSGDSWEDRILTDLGRIWILLLRKDGWADLESIAGIVSQLRDDQEQHERQLLEGMEHAQQARAAGWRLVALYHWAKLSELQAMYLMQGTPSDIAAQLDFHFDRSITAAQEAGDLPLASLLRWQQVMAHRMAAGSLWSVARLGPEMRDLVVNATHAQSMFEMLPPQRIAIQEQGLLDPASAAIVVDLPTSAGKTILAEFKIIQALSQFKQEGGWIAYVAPTRALVSQMARRLRRDFSSAGLHIEELTSAVEIDDVEASILNADDDVFDVLVSTPEKLNLVIRSGSVARPLALLVLDEAHNIESEDRGIRIELLLATVKRDCPEANFVLLMPYVPNGESLAKWLAPQTGRSISLASIPWQPNDRLVGLVRSAGRARKWGLEFLPLLTSAPSLYVTHQYQLGAGPQVDDTHSSIQTSLSKLAGAASITLSERGTSIVVCQQISSVWTVANMVAGALPESPDEDIAMVQRFLAAEVSPEFELIELLRYRVGVHHAGLSDETRSLMEWLAELGKLRVLVATTGLSQGLNFPVSSIVLASRNLPAKGYSRPMSPREFWNLAGRAGRVDQDSIGIVGLSCRPGDEGVLANFVAEAAGDLVSRLVTLLKELEDAGQLIGLERSIYGDQWADFRSYVAHLFAQKKNLDTVLAETELLLRNTFGYSSLAESDHQGRRQGQRLLEATRSYATDLAGRVETATLADSTGFTPEGIRSAMNGMRELGLDLGPADWMPDSLFGSVEDSPLPDLLKVMLLLPQIRDSIEELSGVGAGIGERAAQIACDWVDGVSLADIAARHFSASGSTREALTAAAKAIYRNLANAGTWGLSALSKLPTSGIDYAQLSGDELRRINLLGAMLYHGVNTEAGVVMRMVSVPRSTANALGAQYAASLDAESDMRPSGARAYLRQLTAGDWQRYIPQDSPASGGDFRRVWMVLAGES